MTPYVSVIMPAFNAAPYVTHAIASILDQTFDDLELLVIDDGSTDSTVELVSGFSDPRLRLLRNEKNLGLVTSLTRGLSAARGELIARMDADDISRPRRIERLFEMMDSDPGLGMVSCAYEDFDNRHDTICVTVLPTTDPDIRRDLYCKTHVFCHAGSMIRKEALRDVGGYRAEWFPVEDRDLWLRMMTRWRGANTSEILYRVRIHQGSVVATHGRQQSQLVILSTVEALQDPGTPPDVPPRVRHVSWSRGALFAAFGLALTGDQEGSSHFFRKALNWDESTAMESFDELLQDRIDIHMHHYEGDIQGVQKGTDRIVAVLPSELSQKKPVVIGMLARAHAIAAFQASYAGDAWLARKHALASFSRGLNPWRNRGLLKLVAGKAVSHEPK